MGLQTVKYKYNIRGWLKQINDPSSIGTDLFALKINYNDGTGTDLYNGNISQTQWKTANTDSSLKTYSYTYDALNRITSGIDNTGHYNLTSITYDKNGNIKTLNRSGAIVDNPNPTTSGHWGTMDNLVYTYQSVSNQLKKVQDNGSDNYGFIDGVNQTTEFTYDGNGNMKTDVNKGITSISYNHLNLPIVINFGVSDKIEYIYDATGVKLSKEVTENSAIITTEYAGNFIYENGDLQFAFFPEGYAAKDDTAFDYVYQYKDHLGSIRLSYSDSDENGYINVLSEIIEENNFYPFGLKHFGYNKEISANGNSQGQKWKYQGQEFSEDLELNMYEFKWRMHDPTIGRFLQVDPLAEEYVYNGTYNFSENRVIDGIELEGLEHYSAGSTLMVRREMVRSGATKRELSEYDKGVKDSQNIGMAVASLFVGGGMTKLKGFISAGFDIMTQLVTSDNEHVDLVGPALDILLPNSRKLLNAGKAATDAILDVDAEGNVENVFDDKPISEGVSEIVIDAGVSKLKKKVPKVILDNNVGEILIEGGANLIENGAEEISKNIEFK